MMSPNNHLLLLCARNAQPVEAMAGNGSPERIPSG
jgi:hypothetical protein